METVNIYEKQEEERKIEQPQSTVERDEPNYKIGFEITSK